MVTVREDAGVRELCARVLSGMLMRQVLVNVIYENRNALGEFNMKQSLCGMRKTSTTYTDQHSMHA